jgi:rhodanese-related sulfurtransferase
VYYVAVGSIPGEGRRAATGTTGSGAEEMAMAREISREQVRLLMDEGAQIVDVLPAREYGEDHLPGAINLPLRRIETEAKQILDPARPVVVYCADSG